ncbi:XRE family transcriptional regulator [Sinorhizobium meliloti]|uniref:helix-turn-helix domain-containing protein n=1 Tax=Rhizobium meliloti TaxID=382 RepID=UPI000FD32D54|nr:helix-turn-helix transcriptional regulator [Sinorhizobium meliloti]RVG92109.1 XRE family transcriptional regulator [Sinorhizobium meliloti]RVP82045.1 XRE family transcriptional regulator [Sinorhizobium meliloti]
MKTLVKAARDLLGMTQADLCAKTGIPLITLRRIEGRPDHAGLVSDETVARLKAALEAEGIQFLEDGLVASGPGVALKKDNRAYSISGP